MGATTTEEMLRNVVTGTVVSIDDPTYSGRIKVRVPGLNDNVPVENLYWCTYGGSAFFSGDGGGSISIPRVGTQVRVKFKKGDANSMEWYATNRIDRKLAEELAQDYEGSHAILYDSASDLSILYTNTTGLRLYYKKSFIQISPDNNITIHYGNETSDTQIQLSDGKIDIQGKQEVVITAGKTIRLEAESIILDGKNNVQIKGDTPGEIAVNAKNLYKLLMALAMVVDIKLPSGHEASDVIQASSSTIMNQSIQYI